MNTVFRPYDSSDALRSDRSAGDRLRHRQKVREAIRENIADLIAEESIIGQSGDRIVKVPLRGVKEYRFVFGDNAPQVGEGDGQTRPGQVVGRAQQKGAGKEGPGNRPGIDYYETDISLDELIDIMFEDLELPDMQRRALREVESLRTFRRKGYRRAGVRVHLDKKRTVKSRLRREQARTRAAAEDALPTDPTADAGAARVPFEKDDMRYRHRTTETEPQSNAVVICIMDTSGSMDTLKKYLARSFFFLLYRFVRTRYQKVEVVFIAHHATASEVDEEEFFHKGESGGTMISSGYRLALEVIRARYHPSLWNVYAFHCTDGDNFESDNDAAIKAAEELCDVCNLFGYGEIKPYGARFAESSMMDLLRGVTRPNFLRVAMAGKRDVWPSFKELLSRERAAAD